MVGNSHFVSDKCVIPDGDSAIRGKNCADECAKIADYYFAVGVEIKKSAVVDTRIVPNPNTAFALAAIMQKGK
jgi:hypothetical protein